MDALIRIQRLTGVSGKPQIHIRVTVGVLAQAVIYESDESMEAKVISRALEDAVKIIRSIEQSRIPLKLQ